MGGISSDRRLSGSIRSSCKISFSSRDTRDIDDRGRITLLKIRNGGGTGAYCVHHVDVEGCLPVLLADWDRQCADVANDDVQTA